MDDQPSMYWIRPNAMNARYRSHAVVSLAMRLVGASAEMSVQRDLDGRESENVRTEDDAANFRFLIPSSAIL
jgi:hypothetical protein